MTAPAAAPGTFLPLATALEVAGAGPQRLVLCLAEPAWTTGSKRLRHVLGKDAALGALVAERVVLAVLDPLACPTEDAALRRAVAHAGGALGPPLLVILDADGRVLGSFDGLAFEGACGDAVQPATPSLRALLVAATERAGEEAGDETEREPTGEPPGIGAVPAIMPPRPRELDPFHLLRLIEAGRSEAAVAGLRAVLMGGVRDHVFGGFHRAAREDRLILPQLEKPVLANLAWALVLHRLRASPALDDAALALRQLQGFLEGLLGGDPAVVAAAADSVRHSWYPQEFQHAVRADASYLAGLHFGMTSHASPHILFQSRPRAMTAAAGAAKLEEVAQAIATATARLAAARDQSHPAQRVHSADPVDRGTTLYLALLVRAELGWCPLGGTAPQLADRLIESVLDGVVSSDPLAAIALATLLATRLPAPAGHLAARTERLLAPRLLAHVEPGTGWLLAAPGAGERVLDIVPGLRLPDPGLAVRALRLAGAAGPAARVAARYAGQADLAPTRAHAFHWLAAPILGNPDAPC